eukprot:5062037-Pyramimonas_sp.AAC.1
MFFACCWAGFAQAWCQDCGRARLVNHFLSRGAPQWSRLPRQLRSPECPLGLPNLGAKDRGFVAEGN